jgi:hypothetical protein
VNYPRSRFFSFFVAGFVAAICVAPLSVVAQRSRAGVASVSPIKAGTVPSLVSYSGTLRDASGRTVTSITGVTFLLYKDSQGGAPLWVETQNVTPDKTGHYTVQLGSTTSTGLPSEVFMTGEARWLAVQAADETEQARVLLVAVPYAMKAGDAATIGGLPPSAFVLAAPAANNDAASASHSAATSTVPDSSAPPASSNVTTTGGTVNAIPLFTTVTNIQNSILTQTAATAVNVGGKLNLPATGTATTATGKNSRPEAFVASVFNGSTSTAVPQTFQLQAEPANNNTTTASGTLNLLYASGTAVPAETGLKIANTGKITFATGQTFPGAGTLTGITTAAGSGLAGGGTTGTLSLHLLSTCAANQILKWSGTAWACAADANSGGTITKVTAGADLTGGGATGAVTLNLDTTKVPLLASANTFTNTQTINGGLVASGNVSALNISATNSSPSATAIFGSATSTSGNAWGVEGLTGSAGPNAYGVFGAASSGTGTPYGVYGLANSVSGTGVFGQNGSLSLTGQAYAGSAPAGVFGDGGSTNQGIGVFGTTDDAMAGFFANNSPSGNDTLEAVASNASSNPFIAVGAVGDCYVDANGNLNCTGSKNAVVPVDGGKRIVAMSAIEAPQNWFEDFGEAQLVNGVAVVTLDPDFIQTVNSATNYKVFPVPNGDCKGLYVTNKTANSFEVHELGGGTSSISFDYRITVLRKKYENVRFADHTHDLDGHKRMMARIKERAGHPASHDPVKKLQPTPAKTAQLAVPRLQAAR